MDEKRPWTKGPWLIRRFPAGFGRVYVVNSTPDQNGEFIGQIILEPTTNPCHESNAQLIALAPRLYEDLTMVIKAIELEQRRTYNQLLANAIENAKATLAAASGAEGGE
jgi:hypothetical protein